MKTIYVIAALTVLLSSARVADANGRTFNEGIADHVGNDAYPEGVAQQVRNDARPEGASNDGDREDRIDSTVVSASRAGAKTPVTYSMLSREELRSSSPTGSLPMTLGLMPSVISMNEGGTGLGYSKMTVRGSKGSQVNVTLNGITLNDSESQEVFWVNIPSLSSLISSVQLQRGLGTSASGAGAFGASINMSTAIAAAQPYANVELSAGSFNTFMLTASAGTGLTKSGFYFDAAYSRNFTDGYLDNAFARVQSAYAALGWMKGPNSLRLTYLLGDQHTGITWNGVSYAEIEQYGRRYNSAGVWFDDKGNSHRYPNDTDNYTQHHLQLNYTHQFSDGLLWTTTFNWTHGAGWYDEYKAGKKFSKYGFSDEDLEGLNTPFKASDKGDFIVLKAMLNNYFVLNSQLKWSSDRFSVVGGVNLSQYNGNHYGDMKWSSLLGDGFDYSQLDYSISSANDWYYNHSIKREINLFARAEYSPLNWLTAYVDLQYRGIGLNMKGVDDEDDAPLDYKTAWNFFNPRAGLTFNWSKGHKAYISAALGHREPGRSDIKEVIISNNWGEQKNSLKPEKMVDVEIGYQYSTPKLTVGANLYFMEYWDMLLETGKITDVGYTIKENVDRSYRRGIELSAAWQAAPWVKLDANLTLSLNRVKELHNYIDVYENGDWSDFVRNEEEVYRNTPILMSPSVISMLRVAFTPFKTIAHNSLKTTTLSLDCKFIGKQYWDNTGCSERSLPGYYVANLSLTHSFKLRYGSLGLGVYVNNFTNNLYVSDAWVYRGAKFLDGTPDYVEEGVFPQAPINVIGKVTFSF